MRGGTAIDTAQRIPIFATAATTGSASPHVGGGAPSRRPPPPQGPLPLPPLRKAFLSSRTESETPALAPESPAAHLSTARMFRKSTPPSSWSPEQGEPPTPARVLHAGRTPGPRPPVLLVSAEVGRNGMPAPAMAAGEKRGDGQHASKEIAAADTLGCGFVYSPADDLEHQSVV